MSDAIFISVSVNERKGKKCYCFSSCAEKSLLKGLQENNSISIIFTTHAQAIYSELAKISEKVPLMSYYHQFQNLSRT